jgi:hypothetical protein
VCDIDEYWTVELGLNNKNILHDAPEAIDLININLVIITFLIDFFSTGISLTDYCCNYDIYYVFFKLSTALGGKFGNISQIPTALFLAGIKRVPTDQVDSLAYLVLYPNKQTIWIAILQYYSEVEAFSMEDVCNILFKLETHNTLLPSHRTSFYTVISTTLWYLWYFYWQQVIHN